MRRATSFAYVALVVVSAASCAAKAETLQTDAEVIATERAALDRWGKGDPDGFLTTYAPGVTYFDPTQERRVDGLDAMKALIAPFRGKVRIDRYEMVNPKVQRSGDVAVLTYNLVNYAKQPDGTESVRTRWNSTAVFQRMDGRWRTIHSHWSFVKPELKSALNANAAAAPPRKSAAR